MHCRLDIKKALIKKAIEGVQTKTIKKATDSSVMIKDTDYPAKGQAYRIAERIAKAINDRFGDGMASVTQVTYGQEIKIKPSEALISDYYDGYVKSWNLAQQADTGIDRFGDSKLYSETTSDLIDKDLRSKYFGDENIVKASSILQKISKSDHPLNKLAEHLTKYTKDHDVDVNLDEGSGTAENIFASAYYDVRRKSISIAERANFKQGKAEATLIHEIIHSLTAHKLLDKNSQVTKDFTALYNVAKRTLDTKKYAMSNVDEFLVGLFTDSSLIKDLKEVKAVRSGRYKNLMEEVFNFFLNLFGINKDSTLYEEAFTIATNVIDQQTDTNNYSSNDLLYSKDAKVPNSHFHTNAYAREQQFFKDKIFKLTKALKNLDENTPEYEQALMDLKFYEDRTDKAISTNDVDLYKELGEEALSDIQELVDALDNGKSSKDIDIIQAMSVVDAWREFPELETKAAKLNRELFKHSRGLIEEYTNEVSSRPTKVSMDQIDLQNRDINSPESWWGSLANSSNILASTIGALIGKAHNRISTKNKEMNKKIKDTVKNLAEYSKKNGVKIDNMYDVFIQTDRSGSTALTSKYLSDGEVNPNWDKIQNTPELKEFYDFYQSNIKSLLKDVPSFNGANEFFIPNIKDRDWKDKLKELNPLKTRSTAYSKAENVRADVIPMEMHKSMSVSEKTKNLGEALSFYTAHVNQYHEMNEILPKVRLLQQSIAYVMDPKSGRMVDRQYINPSEPSKPIAGDKTKLYKTVNTIIEMQVKGEMRKNQWKPRYGKSIVDAEGNDIGEKYVDIAGFIDNALSYNSMLRIGLNPINAIANVSFGDASNLIEAVGGRYFTIKGLHQASAIFMKQATNKESVLNKLHERLNVLQEMDDYNDVEEIKSAGRGTKITAERAKEIMFSPQKMGENWIQSRSMLAMLIKDGYLTTTGELTEKYNRLADDEIDRLADKIIGVNHQLHGRYTSKEAAAAQQNIMYRMMIQFRKWIPAAIENRFGAYNEYNNRLGGATEGRYVTAFRLAMDLKTTIKKLKAGKLSELEIYNMRKNITEIAVWTVLAIAFAGLHGGGDDKDKERRKHAMVKSLLTIMTRTSGDISYFYNPASLTKLTENAIPLAKTADDLMKTVLALPTLFEMGDHWEVTKGRNKGKSKFRAMLPKVLLGANPYDQAASLISSDEFKTY